MPSVPVSDDSNRARRQADGALAARLAPSDVLLLGGLDGNGALTGRLAKRWAESPPRPPCGYPVPRQDSHAWFLVTDAHAAALFAKLCAVDLRPAKFALGRIAQTFLADLVAIVIRDDQGAVPAYHLLANSAAAEYLWDCLVDTMAEFDGRPAGWTAARDLMTQDPVD